MRLLQCDDTGRFDITLDLAADDVPPYAILSHTWGPDEVSFADLARTPSDWQQKAGFDKIQFCAEQAKRDGLRYFWIDTYYIDKSNSIELQKAINSMFRWYYDAKRCYVYLPDVSVPSVSDQQQNVTLWEDAFRQSRWFTRGWTLQELIAPKTVEFYSKERRRLGDKRSLETLIRDITGIPASALRGTPLSDFPVSEREAWIRGRRATYEEDMAYSLLGIFDVHMPLIYGEGREKAQKRLREEVLKAVKGTRAADFSVTLSLSEVPETQSFVAREREIAEMRGTLSSDGSRRVVVLQGLGGIGKTQLAVAYMKKYRDEYSAVVWLNVKDQASIQQSFTRIARQILQQHPDAARLNALDLQKNHNEVVEAVKAWLSLPGNTRWLMVCDNYDNPRLAGRPSNVGIDIHRFLPTSHQGSIIVTTRSSQVDIGHLIRIRKLESVDDCLKILSTTSGRDISRDDMTARSLVEELDGLPLALATAGAYLRRVSVSLGDYLRLYKSSWERLHTSTPSLGSYQDRTLRSTWQLSYEQVQEQNPLAAHLLRWWAYFDNEDLWYELLQLGDTDERGAPSHSIRDSSILRGAETTFRAAFRSSKTSKSQEAFPGPTNTKVPERAPAWIHDLTDEIKYNSAMGTLHEYGFVEPHVLSPDLVESRGYSIHSCLHAWTIHVLNRDWDDYLSKLAIRCVAFRVPSQDYVQSWRLQRRLLSHAIKTCANVPGSDEKLGWAFHNLGALYAEQGKLVEAEDISLRALRGKEESWGPDHTSTLDTVNNLGVLYAIQGKLVEAEDMYLRALRGYEKSWGPDHTSTLSAVNNLGALYAEQGKLVEAEDIYLRVLRGYEKSRRPDHTLILDTFNNLGILYAEQGRLIEAEDMYLRALRGYEKLLGPDHTLTLNTVNNLGNLYAEQGKLVEAEDIYLRALRGYEKAVGPQNVRRYRPAINTTGNLGALSRRQGHLAEARDYYQRAHRNLDKLLGPSHRDVQLLQNDLLELDSAINDESIAAVDVGTTIPTNSAV